MYHYVIKKDAEKKYKQASKQQALQEINIVVSTRVLTLSRGFYFLPRPVFLTQLDSFLVAMILILKI